MSDNTLNVARTLSANANLRCFTCLAFGRSIKPSKEKSLIDIVGHEIHLNAKLSGHSLICWECEAMILKIKQFKDRVVKAQSILQQKAIGNLVSEGLSNLKMTSVQTVSISQQNTIISPIVIKEPATEFKAELCDNLIVKQETETNSGDYDHLIPLTTIQQLGGDNSSDPLSSPPNFEVKLEKANLGTTEKEVKKITFNFGPPKVPINMPVQETLAPRGTKETVKVTVGVSNAVKAKEEETKLGIYGFQDEEVKCIMLNKDEMLKYREGKMNHHIFKASRFKCVRCLKKFNTQEHLDSHNKKHEMPHGKFVCDICEQRFPDRDTCGSHYKLHFIIFECLTCAWQSHDRRAISDHIRRVHQISEFECRKCDMVFKTFKEHKKHRFQVHYKKPSCKECGKMFCSLFNLKKHMAIHTSELVDCTVCEKKVRTPNLKAHMLNHKSTLEDTVYCVECDTTYKNKKSYAVHLKTSLKHNSVEKLGTKCDQCGKSFAYKSTLRDHIEVEHSKITVCVCHVCKKEYPTKRRLERHMNYTHRKKIKHRMCDICGKSFTDKNSLIQHLNSHRGHRPYKCQDCGNTFSYSGALYTHRKLVHKVKKKSEKKS